MKPRGEERKTLEFYGGRAGLMTPFVIMFSGIMWLGVKGVALPEAFWAMVLLALFVGLLLARGKERYVEAVIDGISSEMLTIMLLAWFLAGIFGSLLSATGVVNGLVWLALRAQLPVVWFPLVTFLVSTLLSLSTGTSIGTLLAATPILFPAGFSLGADPLLLIGALIGGAYVGDNLAPVSDTTIVSAYSQGTEVGKVVRSRIRYALLAGAMTLAAYALTAWFSDPSAARLASAPSSNPKGLIMLLVPALLVFLMLRGQHLVAALFYTLFVGFMLALATGLIRFSGILSLDPARFTAGGIIIDGINSMMGIAVFAILLMGLVGVLENGGFIEWMMELAEKFATTPTRAELSIVTLALATNALTTAGTPSMVIIGSFVRRLGHRFRITPWRRGNLLDACSTSIIGFLPYSVSVLIPFSLVISQVSRAGVKNFSPVLLIPYVFYCWALMLTIIFAAASGWGRDFQSEEEFHSERRELYGPDPAAGPA